MVATASPKLLSGGNPQIPKGAGDGPVRAWIDAVPGWKSPVWRRLDALIGAAVPDVRRAVKWNSPLYGAPGRDDWFLGVHAFDRYLKVSFFCGAGLAPPPPVASKQKEVRYFHIHEADVVDEGQFADWVRQAADRPGERM